jgi:hypothetical protein
MNIMNLFLKTSPSKSLSPLLSAVILLSLTISIAYIAGSSLSSLTQKQIQQTTAAQASCAAAVLRISKVWQQSGSGFTFDNSNGGVWAEYISFPITTAPTEYAQYKIFINGRTWELYNVTGSLEASGTNDNFWSLVNSTGADIRVFNEIGTQLYFWIEYFNATEQKATIWINVTAGSSELNIAYGNTLALPSAYMNGTMTFEFFDDFDDEIIDTTKWLYQRGTWTESGGYAYVVTDVGNAPGNWLRSSFYGTQYVVEMRVILAADGPDTGLLIHAQGDATQYTAAGYPAAGTRDILGINEWDGSVWGTETTTPFDYTAGESIHLRAVVNGASLTVYDLTHSVSVSRTLTYTSGYIGLHQGAGFTTTGRYDWIFVAKVADPAEFGTPSVRRNSYVVILLQNPSQATLENFYVRIQTEDGNNYVYKLNETLNPGEIKALQIANITGKPVKVEVQAENCPVSAEKVLG